MDKEKLIQRLMATFLGELEEHTRALERDLLALDKGAGADRQELLRTLFRTAHSLKGASRSVNQRQLEAVCHALEGILGGLRDAADAPSPEVVQILFGAVDALKDAEVRLREKQSLDGAPIEAILPQLEATARRSPSGASGERLRYEPAPAPPSARVDGSSPAPPAPPAPSAVAVAEPAPDRPRPLVTKTYQRVSTDKLDALVARSGELLVARRRAEVRLEDVAQIRGMLQRCRMEWQKLERPLRKLARPERGGRVNGRPNARAATSEVLPKRAALAVERTGESLRRLERSLELLAGRLASDQHALGQVAGPLEEDIKRTRMVPFADACEGLERAVRDIARAVSKEVELVVTGGEVELDSAILERLKDPLLHLVRNCVDHGVEPPDERAAAGKPARATIHLSAALRADGVEIAVGDDGRGLDLDAVRKQARRLDLPVPADDREAARYVLLPGFSTAARVTELSGRGIGLDVVKHGVESLHGQVDFTFEPGRGTRFALLVPLTLSMIRAVLIEAGGQVYALPAASVRRLMRAAPEQIASVDGREVLLGDGAPTPLAPLVDVLGVPAAELRRTSQKVWAIVVVSGDREAAIAVDDVIAEQEIVVKGLGPRLRRVRNFAGATILSTGRLALILSAADLVAGVSASRAHRVVRAPQARPERLAKRLLVVDDSVTTRSLEKSILQAAGYDVEVAVDGLEAWQMLQERGADLVVADVEMPRMDGFALCEAIRASKRLRDLPVVLVTALASDVDKARGLEAGADAYLPKGTFDQTQLLETVASLIGAGR